MKVIIFTILAIFIILFVPSQLPQCNIDSAKIAIAPRIFAEITIDGSGQNVLWTRLLHNKPGILLSEISRCYFNVFDLNLIVSTIGIVGLLGFLYFLYRGFISKKVPVIVVILLFPLPAFFQAPFLVTVFIYKLFAIIGLILFFFLRK